MRVAVVDEGIDRRALLHPQRVQKVVFPDAKTGGSEMPAGGHGTDCARILEQCADEYEILDVRIAKSWESPLSVRDLRKALECCIQEEADLICLSLGTVRLSDAEILDPVMAQIQEKEITVVASLSNDGKMTLPGAYPNVICTAMDWNHLLKPGECRTVYHEILQKIYVANTEVGPNKKGVWKGNSYAVPVAAGNLLRWLRKKENGQADEWVPETELSFADFARKGWGKPLESPMVAVVNREAVFETEKLLHTFAEKFSLEAAALVETDFGKGFQIFGKNHYSGSREELLNKMDCCLDISLLLSVYEKEEMEKEHFFYDAEVYCSREKIDFYAEGRLACTLRASSAVETDICRTLIRMLGGEDL